MSTRDEMAQAAAAKYYGREPTSYGSDYRNGFLAGYDACAGAPEDTRDAEIEAERQLRKEMVRIKDARIQTLESGEREHIADCVRMSARIAQLEAALHSIRCLAHPQSELKAIAAAALAGTTPAKPEGPRPGTSVCEHGMATDGPCTECRARDMGRSR